ncbi:hypothetical protein MASR2M47_09700 [Draconibacterium sp.]|jgi:hypothetical protein
MKLLTLILMACFSIFSNHPAKNAKVYLETARGGEVVAFQTAGEKGRVTFNYIKEGSYSLSIVFPQQEGKYIKTKSKYITLTKASYNERTKTYYYQGLEGYFAVKFSSDKKVDFGSFKVVFREEKTDEKDIRIEMVQFIARKSGATFNISINALTASQFKKATDKLKGDISTISIPGL